MKQCKCLQRGIVMLFVLVWVPINAASPSSLPLILDNNKSRYQLHYQKPAIVSGLGMAYMSHSLSRLTERYCV